MRAPACIAALLIITCFAAQADSIDVNGGFERTEAANESFRGSARAAQLDLSARLPQVWQINYGAIAARKADHAIRLVEDPERARSGNCALELAPGEVFLPYLPARGEAKVTVQVWATGKPGLSAGVTLTDAPAKMLYPPFQAMGNADAKGYVEYRAEFALPAGATGVSFTLGAVKAILDDVSVELEGTRVSAPDLAAPVAADEATLALATGDIPLTNGALFTGQLVGGMQGQAYRISAEELLQVPGSYRDLLQGGTIEFWFRPAWEGRDDKDHSLVALSTDGFGYSILRDRYNHVLFSASDGWAKSLGNVQSQHWQYANRWGAGDWHHLAVSWTPDWYTLFLDGFPVDTARTGTKQESNRSWATGKLPSRIPTLAGIGSAGTEVDELRISRNARYWITAQDVDPAQPVATAQADTETPAIPLAGPTDPARPDFSTPPAPEPRPEPAEFFVDTNAANASDENPGTREQPFKTINRGVRELLPGDTLTVRGGVYRESVVLDLIGRPDKPITIQAAPGETVVVKGSEVVTGWEKDGDVWRKTGWTDEFVRQFAVGGRLVSANVHEVFQRDGVRDDAVVLLRVRTPEELREGKCYWDQASGTITIWPVDTGEPFDPNNPGVEVPVRGWGITVGKRHVRVRGFQMRQFNMAGVTNWSSSGVGGLDCSLEDCIVTWANFVGISMSGFDNRILRCEASYCGNSGMGAGVGENQLIEDCVVTHNNYWRYSPGWHGGGAKLIPWFNKSTVRNSEFAFNYGPGLWFDGSCNDSVIEGCYCHDNEGPGIMVEISRGVIVRNNVCVNNRNTLPGIDLSPLEKKGYAPVNCQATRTEGGSGGNGIFISSSPHTKAYNNLCYRNESAGIFAEWARRESGDVSDYGERKSVPVHMSTHDVDVRNNILVNNLSCQLSIRRNGVDEDTYGNQSDYNLLYSSGGVPLVRWGFGGAAFSTVEKWQEASGFGKHSISAAPVFERSPGMDLRLQPDSPGVDQGELLPDVPLDARGRKRPLGNGPDMGPYEIAGTRRIVERPAVPRNLAYTPVDISALMNRGFADEKADDGTGGWSDQGPTTDLRTFPIGLQEFNGVPFQVNAPLGCLVLKSGFRPQSNLPARVVIPVRKKADVLYFLHSGAWLGSGRTHWKYIIRRGDGTSETISVIGGENIRDWSDPNAHLPLDREYPTTTQVAWSGSNQTFEKVSVYMMAWVNPHDWCDVTEVEMVAEEGGGVPILIGITAGVRKPQ